MVGVLLLALLLLLLAVWPGICDTIDGLDDPPRLLARPCRHVTDLRGLFPFTKPMTLGEPEIEGKLTFEKAINKTFNKARIGAWPSNFRPGHIERTRGTTERTEQQVAENYEAHRVRRQGEDEKRATAGLPVASICVTETTLLLLALLYFFIYSF